MDLSQIDFAKLRDEFASKVRRKHAALQDIRDVVEKKLAQMLARNPMRMDYYKKYQEIIADYNREKDRVTVEETFAQLVDLANSLDAEQRRAAEEGLSDDELALFDLLFRESIQQGRPGEAQTGEQDPARVPAGVASPDARLDAEHRHASRGARYSSSTISGRLSPGRRLSDEETEERAARVYDYVWQRSAAGHDSLTAQRDFTLQR